MEEELIHKIEVKKYEQIVHKKYKSYKWLMYLSLFGLSLMFLSLTFLYFVSHLNAQQPDLIIAPVFYWNTIILLSSSSAVIIAQHHYRHDNFSEYKTSLLVWLGLGVLFLVGQICGWLVLFGSGFKFAHHSASYLYVISGIHAVHIIGALAFLIIFINKSWTTLKDYATSVVYFTDPVAQSQLKLFGIFWHFLGVLWLYLLFFFLCVG